MDYNFHNVRCWELLRICAGYAQVEYPKEQYL
jgi:hypothetical protein